MIDRRRQVVRCAARDISQFRHIVRVPLCSLYRPRPPAMRPTLREGFCPSTPYGTATPYFLPRLYPFIFASSSILQRPPSFFRRLRVCGSVAQKG